MLGSIQGCLLAITVGDRSCRFAVWHTSHCALFATKTPNKCIDFRARQAGVFCSIMTIMVTVAKWVHGLAGLQKMFLCDVSR
jgi:hypothetical protein